MYLPKFVPLAVHVLMQRKLHERHSWSWFWSLFSGHAGHGHSHGGGSHGSNNERTDSLKHKKGSVKHQVNGHLTDHMHANGVSNGYLVDSNEKKKWLWKQRVWKRKRW